MSCTCCQDSFDTLCIGKHGMTLYHALYTDDTNLGTNFPSVMFQLRHFSVMQEKVENDEAANLFVGRCVITSHRNRCGIRHSPRSSQM